jgi:hypothetical protein
MTSKPSTPVPVFVATTGFFSTSRATRSGWWWRCNAGPADPVDATKLRMEQQGLTARDLEPSIGPCGRVSEVLNRKRPLSLRMIKQLHEGLRVPYESLLAAV